MKMKAFGSKNKNRDHVPDSRDLVAQCTVSLAAGSGRYAPAAEAAPLQQPRLGNQPVTGPRSHARPAVEWRGPGRKTAALAAATHPCLTDPACDTS